MDPIKVIIFVAAFLLLLLLGRKFSGPGEVHAYNPSDAIPPQPEPVSAVIEEALKTGKAPALVGSELPFPVSVPELTMDDDGRYNRPEFVNYYFGAIDLVQGPPEPQAFADEFFVETRDPDNAYVYTYKFMVATPQGLQRAMESEHLPSLYVEGQSIIVPRWDLKVILTAAVQQIIEKYGVSSSDYSREHALPDDGETQPS